jgi:hypothetical protein
MNDPAARYAEALAGLPKPGYGLCYHAGSLGVATLGVRAGLSSEQIVEDLHRAAQGGKRREPISQIVATVRRAFADHGDGRFVPTPKPRPLINGPVVLKRLIEPGRGATEADILGASPVPIPDRPEDHAVLLLQTLYPPDVFLFTGDRYDEGVMGKTIRTCAERVQCFLRGEKPGPHIIANPLDGKPHPTKSNEKKMTYRGDACVSSFGLCVVEFDGLDRGSQIAFWAAVNLPIVALIDSGGKSLHAWIDVQKLAPVRSMAEWDANIRNDLYQRFLVPMGVDGSCSNASRLSRLPGHFRDTGRWQRLLFLSPNGRRIFS